MKPSDFPSSTLSNLLFKSEDSAILWFLVRLYLGYEWFKAGFEKFKNPVWFGDHTGDAVTSFLNKALEKTSGPYPDVSHWYASFIQNFALHHTTAFSYAITFGEMAVGIALIFGFLTGISAFFGLLMNVNFLLAGTVSINPQMAILGIFLILAWRNAGWFGFDRYIFNILYPKPPEVITDDTPKKINSSNYADHVTSQ